MWVYLANFLKSLIWKQKQVKFINIIIYFDVHLKEIEAVCRCRFFSALLFSNSVLNNKKLARYNAILSGLSAEIRGFVG